jgi:hypothetical protein
MADNEETHDPLTEALSNEVFASMRQCAAVKGIPLSVLKAAKEAGAPGFRPSNRVYWEDLAPWLEQHREALQQENTDTKEYWAKFKLRCDGLRSELALKKDNGELLSKTEVSQQLTRLSLAAASLLRTKLEEELPPRLLGLDVIAIREQMAKAVDSVCEVFQKGVDQWI